MEIYYIQIIGYEYLNNFNKFGRYCDSWSIFEVTLTLKFELVVYDARNLCTYMYWVIVLGLLATHSTY